MFLIEGDSKAILYTGDVRAEPWWVNSIIQNPSLLRYTGGLGTLDCIYLDTTFATHDDKYKRFPGKSEGLRELMTKVAECDPDSVLYFRAWTLGYEQVWITLADILKCKVHVDEYQMRLFDATIEDSKDGYSTLEGPALVGFPVGNSIHPGCLSRDSDTRLHSCEPGMPCHRELQHKKVVWITPIISRMTDGTEVLELGAGGGGGDLSQTQELDFTNDFDLQTLELVCKDNDADPATLERICDAIRNAKQVGQPALSLEGLGLDSDAQVSLREFLKLIASRKDWKGRREPAGGYSRDQVGHRNIHFPYSRHSSYEELRHLVSVFRPTDVYACTVDLAGWSDDVSMKSLFGDLCSGQDFQHDNLVRSEASALQKEKSAKTLKRKRDSESQQDQNSSQIETPLSPSFYSAQVSLSRENENIRIAGTEIPDTTSHLPTSEQQLRPADIRENGKNETDARVRAIRQEFLIRNNGQATVVHKISESMQEPSAEPAIESQASLGASAFDSQEDDLLFGETPAPDAAQQNARRDRQLHRKEAYRLAKGSIATGDSSDWDDIGLQSVGRPGNADAEMEL